jgi:O-antigen ligase
MHWLLGGYMWLFIHRPFEYYHALGDLQIERIYMILMLVYWLVWPGKSVSSNRLHLALAGFTTALVVCWGASPFRDQTWETTLEHYVKVLVFYLLMVTSVRDEPGLRRLITMYLVAVGLYMGHSMLEYLHGRYEWRMGIRRMIGVDVTYRDPNAFASTLLLALPLTTPLWKRAKGSRKLALAAFTGGAGLCVLLTGSRTGFVGLGVVGLMLLWSSRYRMRLLVVGLPLALVVAAALPDYLQDRFLTIIDPSRGPQNAQTSAEGRIVGLLDGLSLWERSPIVGVGPGAFGMATGRGYNPHNVYGQVLGEMGTLGVVAFAGLLLAFLTNSLHARRLGRQAPGLAVSFPAEVSQAISRTVLLLLLLGCAGHNLYRYNWVWLAAFEVVAIRGLQEQAAAIAVRARPRFLPGGLGHRPALAAT